MSATDSVASPVNWKRHYFGAGYLTLSFVQDLTLFHEGARGRGGGVLNSAIDFTFEMELLTHKQVVCYVA